MSLFRKVERACVACESIGFFSALVSRTRAKKKIDRKTTQPEFRASFFTGAFCFGVKLDELSKRGTAGLHIVSYTKKKLKMDTNI